MKKSLLALLLCIGTFFAEEGANRIYFGPEFLGYTEDVSLAGIHISGTRFYWGFSVGYEYCANRSVYFALDAMAVGSTVDFKASENGSSLAFQPANRIFSNIDIKLGYTFSKGSCFYGVLGLWGLRPGDGHLKEGFQETLPYYGVGSKIEAEISKFFRLGILLEGFHTFSSYMKFKYPYGEATSRNEMWGIEVGAPVKWTVGQSEKWDILLQPYYLRIGFADAQQLYGTKLQFGYQF